MSSDEKQERYERAYQKAMEIIDQAWLEAGMTREEIEQDNQLAEIFDRTKLMESSSSKRTTAYSDVLVAPRASAGP